MTWHLLYIIQSTSYSTWYIPEIEIKLFLMEKYTMIILLNWCIPLIILFVCFSDPWCWHIFNLIITFPPVSKTIFTIINEKKDLSVFWHLWRWQHSNRWISRYLSFRWTNFEQPNYLLINLLLSTHTLHQICLETHRDICVDTVVAIET